MSEYWVAHKKYFCKYCNIYIADDAPSRKQHETGLRHKGNVERFVRGLYKAGEKRKQDLDEEKREMVRIEKAAGAAFAQDVSAGLVKVGSSSTAAGSSSEAGASSKKVAAPKPSNPYANYSTAESLGYVDPDAERAKAEAERRRTQGVAGEWEVVDIVPLQGEGRPGEEGDAARPGLEARAGEKRLAETPLDEEDARGWKLRRKTAGVGLGDLYDPLALPIKLKPKKEEPALESASGSGTVPVGGSEKPKWSARGWNKPGASFSTASLEKSDGQEEAEVEGDQVKVEDRGSMDKLAAAPIPTDPADVKAEEVKAEAVEPAVPPPTSSGSLFKKRKAPAGGGSRGGRRI
ncbi:hypothetical protein C8Q80DRAFT_1185602 [Daedaleopsis nitida]|nr:hypothetical protein C8Q80DRAFT_1185602 [Daedaleopsis nitida]